jgi:hypothetical protein
MSGSHRVQKATKHHPGRRWSNRTRAVVLLLDMMLWSGAAVAVTNWVVGIDPGSSGMGQSASITNLQITAIASPAAGNLLYPGGTGDVVIKITNPNPFPVTITAVQLPTNTTYADGFTTNALSVSQTGCTSGTPSGVTWSFATGSSGTSHTLTTPLTVAANGQSNSPLSVTLTNDASMALTSPAACVATFFSMPSFTGVTATGGAASATTSPATDSWTS